MKTVLSSAVKRFSENLRKQKLTWAIVGKLGNDNSTKFDLATLSVILHTTLYIFEKQLQQVSSTLFHLIYSLNSNVHKNT